MNDRTFNSDEASAADAPPPQPNSLAGLLTVLFREFLDNPQQTLPEQPLADRWRAALRVPEGISLYFALGDLERACDRLTNQLDGLEPRYRRNRELTLQALQSIRRSFRPDALNNGMDHARRFITPDRLNTLDMAAELLLSVAVEAYPPEGAVPEVLAKLDALDDALASAPFPNSIKARLEYESAKLRWAITNWHLLGGEAAATALGGLALNLHLAEGQVEPGTDFASVRTHVVSIVDWIGRYQTVDAAVQFALGTSLPRLLGFGP